MGMTYDANGTLSVFNFEEIITEMPVLKSMDLELTVVSFSEPIDSSNVTIDHWNHYKEWCWRHLVRGMPPPHPGSHNQ